MKFSLRYLLLIGVIILLVKNQNLIEGAEHEDDEDDIVRVMSTPMEVSIVSIPAD